MSFFEEDDHHNVEGTDTFNACYGGTNALFSTNNWVGCRDWDGTYGTVVCSDPAVHPNPAHISGVGASSVSMLLFPQAHLVIEGGRSTFIKHSWDFY